MKFYRLSRQATKRAAGHNIVWSIAEPNNIISKAHKFSMFYKWVAIFDFTDTLRACQKDVSYFHNYKSIT